MSSDGVRKTSSNSHKISGDLSDLQRLHTGKAEAPISLEWQNLTFSVGEKVILKGVSGLAEPGRLVGVMGPSGCGKTTLLNVLSGRQRTSGREKTEGSSKRVLLKGKVSACGKAVKPNEFHSNVAYVFQDNALMRHETPRECLNLSAYLRLPADVSSKDRKQLVGGMLERLRLNSCADTIVGDETRKGLSGGEQKRTAVGVELISNPKLIFLDEPLSGLDSFNAYTLMKSLKDLCLSGVPVLMTLHQPSSEIFDQLDDILILHDGEVCYYGLRENLVGHFEQLGFDCPPNYNPADRVLFIIQQEAPEEIRRIKDSWLQSGSSEAMVTRIEKASDRSNVVLELMNSSSESEETVETSSTGEEEGPCAPQAIPVTNRYQKGWCATLWALIKRDVRALHYSWKIIFQQAIVGNFIVAVVYSTLFYRKGAVENRSCSDIDGSFDPGDCQRTFLVHFAILSMIGINVMFASHAWALEVLQVERSAFLREVTGGYYQVFPYIATKTLYEVPLMATQVGVMLLGTYWLVGLRGNFIFLAMEMEMLAISSSSVMYCLSAFSTSRAQASSLAIMPQILQFGFSGVLLPIQEIPRFLQWIKWLCPLYYGLGMLGVTEFHYVYKAMDDCKAEFGEAWKTKCPSVELRISSLNVLDIYRENFWLKCCISLLLFVGLRILASIILWRKSRFVL